MTQTNTSPSPDAQPPASVYESSPGHKDFYLFSLFSLS